MRTEIGFCMIKRDKLFCPIVKVHELKLWIERLKRHEPFRILFRPGCRHDTACDMPGQKVVKCRHSIVPSP